MFPLGSVLHFLVHMMSLGNGYTAVNKEDFSKLPCGEIYPKASTFTWITPEKTNIPKKFCFFVFICVHVCPVIETNSEQAFIFVSFRLLPSVSHVTSSSPGYEKASLPGRYGGRDGCFAVKKTLLCTFPPS